MKELELILRKQFIRCQHKINYISERLGWNDTLTLPGLDWNDLLPLLWGMMK